MYGGVNNKLYKTYNDINKTNFQDCASACKSDCEGFYFDLQNRCYQMNQWSNILGPHPNSVGAWEKINKEYLKMTGIYAGCMGNIPGGEAFVTPEYIKGIFVGDVVIHVDKSYALNEKDPFVVECYGNTYKVLSAPKKILEEFNKRKKESYDMLLQSEKNKSLPQEIIDLKKKNFEGIGEFAINTNPKAKLCDYLIVNEKIAKMMHIALGSGYEPDRSTEYHMDIVFNAPRQKLDVFGTDKKGNKHWILKDGEFVA